MRKRAALRLPTLLYSFARPENQFEPVRQSDGIAWGVRADKDYILRPKVPTVIDTNLVLNFPDDVTAMLEPPYSLSKHCLFAGPRILGKTDTDRELSVEIVNLDDKEDKISAGEIIDFLYFLDVKMLLLNQAILI